MMQERGVKVLAVQESKLQHLADELNGVNLRYLGGKSAIAQGHTRTGGTGFLVTSEAETMVSYYGRRPAATHTSATRKHAAEWLRILGTCAAEDVWLASIYLPDISQPRAGFEQALADLQSDVLWYKQKPGTVMLAGDFNARVGHAELAGMDHNLRVVAPAYGEDVVNRPGRQLLEFCEINDLTFMSGAYADGTGPTYVQRGGAVGHMGAHSIVDHIISSAPQPAGASPTPCFSLHGEAGDVEFAALFDHRPVLIHCPMGKRTMSKHREVSVRWRTERVYDTTTQSTYHRAVAAHRRSLNAPALCQAVTVGDLSALDHAAAATLSLFEHAASQVLGSRTVVHGVTKRWTTPEQRAAGRRRMEAYSNWRAHPSEASAEMLSRCTEGMQAANRSARCQRRAKAASTCERLWREAPNTHAAHQSVAQLARSEQPSSVATLRHPETGQECTTAKAKADAFAATYAAIFRQADPVGITRRQQHADDVHAVREARQSTAPGPEQLEKPFTAEEVRQALGATPNRKAPGDDHLPAELLKMSGPAGVAALCDLFNAILVAERTPSTWRKGTITSLYKRDDPTDCDNYRPITLLRSMDKLWGRLLVRRLQHFVPLHDQQYGFRTARGTDNALFNLTSVLRTRIPAGLPTYACFFDARKAFDTVPREAMLGRLIAKGVTGKMFKAIDQMYQHAANVARVDGEMSERFPVERGVAQGCPMSPFLYAVFIDSVLEDLDARCAADGVPVGSPEWARMLVGQLYADDLTTLATSAAGKQRVLDVVRAHSQRWGWDLATAKTVPVIFGDATVRAATADEVFWWGDVELRPRPSAKCLGVIFRADGSWQDQEDAAAKKCLAAFHAWAPALSSRRLPVNLKRDIIRTRIVPTATYATEVWEPPSRNSNAGASVDKTLHKARRLAVGVHATDSERSWERGTCISAEVLQADFQALNEQEYCDAAHVRYAERKRVADAAASGQRAHDTASPQFVDRLPASSAPDFMGAAMRSGLAAADPWCTRVHRVRAAITGNGADEEDHPGDDTTNLSNEDISAGVQRSAADRRLQDSVANPTAPSHSSRGRPLGSPVLNGEHLNPLSTVLAPDAPVFQSLQAVPEVVRPILALRSGRLPGAHAPVLRHQNEDGGCPKCQATLWGANEHLTEVEERWRVTQHHLLHCAGGDDPTSRPSLDVLHSDLTDAAAGYPDCLAALQAAFNFMSAPAADQHELAAAACVPYLIDPVAVCCAPLQVGLVHCSLVAAYTLAVGAGAADQPRVWPSSLVSRLRLPLHSRLRRWMLASGDAPDSPVTCVVRATPPLSDSDDEAWLRPDSPPPASDYERAVLAAHVGAEAEARPG